MTPEDAYVAALNTCFHMMFIWATERLRIQLVSYECEAEGHVVDLLDRTSMFTQTILRPKIKVKAAVYGASGKGVGVGSKVQSDCQLNQATNSG